MAIGFLLETEGTLLSMVVSGTIDCIEDMSSLYEGIADALDGIGTRHCVCDIRGVRNNLDLEGLHQLADIAFQAMPGGGRLAIIFDLASRDRASYFVTMVRDGGVNARVFDDPQQARRWLDGPPYLVGT